MHRKGEIDRYLAEGLPEEAVARLRAHLRGCASCRRHYDEQVLLLRALAGPASQPTAAEARRMERLALAKAGLAVPGSRGAGRLSQLLDALLWVPRRQLALAAAAAVVLLAGALLLRPQPVPAGRVTVVSAARVGGKAAAVGTTILSGERIQVGGALELALVRGGRLRLFPGARLVLSPRGETVELEAGKVWCEVQRTGGAFAVRTDAAEARVLGTTFFVEKQKGETEVRVASGSVEVAGVRGRGKVLVKAGQKTRVAPGSAPAAATRYSGEEDRLDWDRMARGLGEALKELLEGR